MSELNWISRRMIPGDLAGADELRRMAGWNQTPEDWQQMLQLQPKGCFVAEADRQIIGTVTTTSYGRTLAWIGMMLVHPVHRRKGIGRALMLQALDYLRSCVGCVRLDATPAGYPLYESLGFVPEWSLSRWERPANPANTSDPDRDTNVREMLESDWAEVVDLDGRSLGVPRPALLHSLAGRARRRLVWPREGPTCGWGLLRPGSRSDYLGPLASSCSECAAAIAAALLASAEGRSVFWDIPDQNDTAVDTAQRLGFARVRPLTRMRFGPSQAEPDVGRIYGIADPAVG